MSIEKLQSEFRRGRRDFKKLFENDEWYIYDVTINYKGGIKDHCIEVFKKRVHEERQCINGQWISTGKMAEYYPGSEEFGKYSAWCCMTFDRAMKYVSGELPNK